MTPTIQEQQVAASLGAQHIASAFGNVYRFAGRRFDDQAGLYYNRNRYYEPRSGRFLSRDPLGFWEDEANLGNAYTYGGNNAVNRTDSLGLQSAKPKPKAPSKPGRSTWMTSKALDKVVDKVVATGVAIIKIVFWYSELPDCPCENPDRKGVKTDDDWASEGTSHAHPGAAECFRSYPRKGVNKLALDGPGQQCCYDKCGTLITGGAGAGTPDRYNSAEGEDDKGKVDLYVWGGIKHVSVDYVPYQALGWKRYNLLWPPNQGSDAKPCPKNVV